MSLQYKIISVTPFAQNCTVLWCDETRSAAIVDPGGEVARIVEVVEKMGLRAEKILVTHGHIDHAGGVGELAERLSLPIEGPHRADAFWIEGLEQQSTLFGFPRVRCFTPTRWLEHGDQVHVGEVVLDVLHCPGHTPGHVAFFAAVERLALVGDVLFKGSIGRTDLPQGDYEALISSIHHRLWPLGDDVTFIPGHGAMSTLGEERRSNPFCGD